MSDQAALFDVEPVEIEPAEPLSATQRRTRRQAAFLAHGRHPLSSPMGVSIFLHAEAASADDRDAPGRRCGNCRWRQLMGHHERSYPKCYLPLPVSGTPGRISNSEATDVRAWWPACTSHEWADKAMRLPAYPP